MWCQETFNCTHCMARRTQSCSLNGAMDAARPVASTLEAHLNATEVRMANGPSRVRATLGVSMSAVPFGHALGALHGLSTGGGYL